MGTLPPPARAVVSAAQMRQIEQWVFEQGMPVAALMEKAALAISRRLQQLYPLPQYPKAGILVGPGHNGGDALVVARELSLGGYQVKIFLPFQKLKPLTQNHADYTRSLGITWVDAVTDFQDCNFCLDGLFGFGLTRPLNGAIAAQVEALNQLPLPIVSIDLPSGIHTDSGEILGIAVRASHSFCLGLWKRAYFQDPALPYLGQAELLEIGLPPQAINGVLGTTYPVQVFDLAQAQQSLPLVRSVVTHKYQQGHVLLICGSQQYAGGAILTALGARGSGVGMVTLAVPQTIKPLLNGRCPEALVVGCPETDHGAIASLPGLDLSRYSAIALGPGLGLEAGPLVQQVLHSECILVLDADALNQVAQRNLLPNLATRGAPTVLTPHNGEFRRLFPSLDPGERLQAVQRAAQMSNSIVLLKGAKTAIAEPTGSTWVIKDSTPALARGGSGDVLTGLMGGLLAQSLTVSLGQRVAGAAWWHAQAGLLAAQERTVLGVDGEHLAEYLIPACRQWGGMNRQ